MIHDRELIQKRLLLILIGTSMADELLTQGLHVLSAALHGRKYCSRDALRWIENAHVCPECLGAMLK